MAKIEEVKDFYNRKLGWVPDNFHQQIGHFNVFELNPFVGKNAQPVPYVRRNFYKVMFVQGRGTVFKEPTHFNYFFKKQTQMSPSGFRPG